MSNETQRGNFKNLDLRINLDFVIWDLTLIVLFGVLAI
jgi:hypothetical protein